MAKCEYLWFLFITVRTHMHCQEATLGSVEEATEVKSQMHMGRFC